MDLNLKHSLLLIRNFININDDYTTFYEFSKNNSGLKM